jgi:hypothetical protein
MTTIATWVACSCPSRADLGRRPVLDDDAHHPGNPPQRPGRRRGVPAAADDPLAVIV